MSHSGDCERKQVRGRKEKNNIKPLQSGSGKKVQHCADPESPPVPDFPQDHLKSSSTNPASSEKTQGFSLMDNALAMCSSGLLLREQGRFTQP